MSHNKRTRSQLTLPDFGIEILTRSPLKEARIARKHLPNHSTRAMADMNIAEGNLEPSEDGKEIPAKRPSSPLKDTPLLAERDLKRAKREGSPGSQDENEGTPQDVVRSRTNKKPSSISSLPSPKAATPPPGLQRSQSAPLEPAATIPHLDLSRIPPSPRRTPAPKLRIAAFPSVESIPDVPMEPQDSPGSLSRSAELNTLLSSGLQGMAQPVAAPSSDVPPPTSPMPSPISSPGRDAMQSDEERSGTPTQDSGRMMPSSPLTPLPRTPWVSKIAVASRSQPGVNQHSFSDPDIVQPKTPSAPPSRLQGSLNARSQAPSTSATTLEFIKSDGKPKPTSRVKAMKPATGPIPLGGRMTRSAALRFREIKKREELAASETAVKTPGPSRREPSNIASIFNGPTPGKSNQRRRSMSVSHAMPTASSAAKSNPSSPTKPHSSAQTSSAHQSFWLRAPSQPPPSLSSLSQALEKLNVPPPSRPNTSLGFNRNSHTDTDDDDAATHSTSTQGSVRRSLPMKRSATLGSTAVSSTSSAGAPSSSSSSSKMPPPSQSRLMPPPPIPKGTQPLTAGQSLSVPTAPKRTTLQSGMISGKPKGPLAPFGGVKVPPISRPRIFGVSALAGAGPKSRVIHRVSKQSSLPVVEGSPAKAGGADYMQDEVETGMFGPHPTPKGKEVAKLPALFAQGSFTSRETPMGSFSSTPILSEPASEEVGKAQEPPSHADMWKDNATRRASLASQLLSQSLSTLPQTPPIIKPPAPSPEVRVPSRAGLRSSSAAHAPSAQGARTAPGALGKGPAPGRANGAHVSTQGKGKSSAESGGAGTPSVLKVLKDCTIFVDVRTDDGDDAGALFVDMLRGLGAKILARVGQKCTHIVYKNGLMSTLTRYRLLHEPKPLVVGIAWVVECAEQRTKVDEQKFIVDLEGVNVAGTNKRRRSMLPKSLSNDILVPLQVGVISPGSGEVGNQNGMHPDASSSSIVLADDSPKADNLTPLERARRRHNTIKTMFGRA